MKKFCVIGNPIDHSLSPKLHNFWLKKNRIEAVYEKKLLEEKEIPKLIESIRKSEINGVNVTVPFKNSVIPFLDSLSSEAKKTNSVNTICTEENKIIESKSFQYSEFNNANAQNLSKRVMKFKSFQNRVKQNGNFQRTIKRHIALKKRLWDQGARSYSNWSQETSRKNIKHIKAETRKYIKEHSLNNHRLLPKF